MADVAPEALNGVGDVIKRAREQERERAARIAENMGRPDIARTIRN